MAEIKKELGPSASEAVSATSTSIEEPTGKSASEDIAAAKVGDVNSYLSGEESANKNANANANANEKDSKSNKRKKNAYFQKKAKKKVERQKNMRNTWKARPDEAVHPGSYADPEMREMFNVSIPELDSTDAVKNDEQKEKNNDDGTVSGDQKETVEKKSQNDESKTGTEVEVPAVKKNPKRKVALLLGFKGTEYVGMQINKGQKTIQAQVELGLFKAGLIAKSNFGHPKKYGWSNSARTDKGVHSCAQGE